MCQSYGDVAWRCARSGDGHETLSRGQLAGENMSAYHHDGVPVRLTLDTAFGEVDLKASAEELIALAGAVARGTGRVDSTATRDSGGLAGIQVVQSSGPGVRIDLDTGRNVLVISGDQGSRRLLAENLHDLATVEDGYHLHIDYFPDHSYLAEGSMSLVVSSPRGGMPAR